MRAWAINCSTDFSEGSTRTSLLNDAQLAELTALAGFDGGRSRMVLPGGDDPLEVAAELGLPLVVKAQALTGGRGKAGGVRVARTADELARDAAEIGAMTYPRSASWACCSKRPSTSPARSTWP